MLRRAAEALLDRAETDVLGALDLSNWIVVTPGARGGRTLLAMLVEAARARSVSVVPPLMTTPGEIGPALLHPSGVPIGEYASSLLWSGALRSFGRAELEPLIRTPPEKHDAAAWTAIGDLLAGHHQSLAGDLLDFADVASALVSEGRPDEAVRWTTAAEVQRRYISLVAETDMIDLPHEIHRILKSGAGQRGELQVALIGVTELSSAAREAIRACAAVCTAFITAPERSEAGFDRFGCIDPDWWETRPLQIEDAFIRIAGDPEDAASAVFEAIAEWGGELAASEIVIGALEPSSPGAIEREAAMHEGVAVRDAAGRSLAVSSPVRLLELLSDLISERSYDALGSALRHSDLGTWIVRHINRKLAPTGGKIGLSRILRELDEFRQETLIPSIDDPHENEILMQVLAAIRNLLRPTGFARGRDPKQTLAHWAHKAAATLAKIYSGRIIAAQSDEGRLISEACRRVRLFADDAQRLESTGILAGHTTMRASEAWRLIAGVVGEAQAPLEARDDAVELLGWLELALDPAQGIVLVGMNEGIVPSTRLGDALLPDALRERLGIGCDRTRIARDRYLLESIMHARSPGKTILIVQRTDAEGSPLLPSRLILRDEPMRIAERLERITQDGRDPLRRVELIPTVRTGDRDHFAMPSFPASWKPITRMSVTSFGRYLRSPYGFFLERALYLEEIDDRITELDAMSFGTLVHDVLEAFGNSDVRDETDPERIAEYLSDALGDLVRSRYGDHPRAPVLVQAESARRRLIAFAAKQAEWVQEGWRIRHAEWRPDDGAIDFMVDAEPMRISGKIDRIDYNEQSGLWALLDYKTGSSSRKAKSAHQARDGTWRDLQLPLYRHLALDIIGDALPELGYITLPRDLDAIRFDQAGWDAADLDSADAAATEIIRAVRRGDFGVLGDAPPEEGVMGWLCGSGFLSTGDAAP
ncbi:MAG: PD-(D/E)XK nuclease family protein [Phycisphaeraceae bacterium]|nr:MAG: PD-(D/E)XK nuclease family protein [Phycisphaeraceae bacterium]